MGDLYRIVTVEGEEFYSEKCPPKFKTTKIFWVDEGWRSERVPSHLIKTIKELKKILDAPPREFSIGGNGQQARQYLLEFSDGSEITVEGARNILPHLPKLTVSDPKRWVLTNLRCKGEIKFEVPEGTRGLIRISIKEEAKQ